MGKWESERVKERAREKDSKKVREEKSLRDSSDN